MLSAYLNEFLGSYVPDDDIASHYNLELDEWVCLLGHDEPSKPGHSRR